MVDQVRNMELISNREVCDVCQYFKFHHNEIICPPKHFTCLCELLKKKYICCKKGYSNLIANIPYMALYSPTPEAINSCFIQSSLDYKPSDKTILETISFAYESKVEAVKSLSKPQIKHPYFNYDEK